MQSWPSNYTFVTRFRPIFSTRASRNTEKILPLHKSGTSSPVPEPFARPAGANGNEHLPPVRPGLCGGNHRRPVEGTAYLARVDVHPATDPHPFLPESPLPGPPLAPGPGQGNLRNVLEKAPFQV